MPWDAEIAERIALTQNALAGRAPIYEAAFSAGGMYAQIDILNPAPGERWDVIEVKSSTAVKDEHLPDVAFQRRVCELSGLKIRRCLLAH